MYQHDGEKYFVVDGHVHFLGCRSVELAEGARAVRQVRWLRMARLVRTSLDVNRGICRDLLRARHGVKVERTVQE